MLSRNNREEESRLKAYVIKQSWEKKFVKYKGKTKYSRLNWEMNRQVISSKR